ncbi:MAG: hypothetical protein NTV05_08140 [Acidobacteria bacterium]|nr:hypothetical protein [Acidobacteriota bacterium]
MIPVLLLAGLFLCPPLHAAAQPPNFRIPNRPGVFAVTNQGVVEMTVFGERRSEEYSIPSFVYGSTELDQIPIVASIRSIYVNMMGWSPRDLCLIVGRQRLATPRDDFRRLIWKFNPRGVVSVDIVSQEFQPEALQKYQKHLTSNSRPGDDVRAFIVLELRSQSGLAARGYPVQVEIQPDSVRR